MYLDFFNELIKELEKRIAFMCGHRSAMDLLVYLFSQKLKLLGSEPKPTGLFMHLLKKKKKRHLD